MSNFIDLTGQRFGRLIVQKISYTDKHKHIHWECQCDCGNTSNPDGQGLRKGTTKSCGCLAAEKLYDGRNKLPPGEASFNGLYGMYKRGAEKRGHCFVLSKDDFRHLIDSTCKYCGTSPSTEHGKYDTEHRQKNGSYVYNGIDRVDNTKGYTLGNVVTCCKFCNRSKYDLSEPEFLNHINRIHKYQEGKK